MLMRTPPKSSFLEPGRQAAAWQWRAAIPLVESLDEALDLMGAAMPFSRNMEIYGEGEPAEYLYKVLQGAVRTHKLSMTAGARSAVSTFPAISSAWKSTMCIG
jgi:CRP-like cAMP-binding protein